MTPDVRAAHLVHDVGKYIARIARNVAPDGSVPATLVPLLVADLYQSPGGGRPSERFEALAEQGDRRLEPVRTLFAELDRLEAAVRGRDDAACRRACDIAREIEVRLRSIAAEVTP